MKVADIVREIDKREALENCILHGKVRGIISSPNGFEGLSPSSGDWAVLELYAITVKGENYFGFGETTFLTPRSTILFVLEDKSFIGKLVTVSGKRGRGIKLRRQKMQNNRLGYFVPVFAKGRDLWKLEPNTVTPFKGTTSKEIDLLFKEYEKFEPYYLTMTKSVVGFDGTDFYNYIEDDNKVSRGSLSYITDFTQRVNREKEEELSSLLSKAKGERDFFLSNVLDSNPLSESIKNDFVKSFNNLRKVSSRLIPETTSRFKDVVSKKVKTYSEALSLLIGVDSLKHLESDILLEDPFYYYLSEELDFDTCEMLFFISSLIKGEDFTAPSKLRGISVVVEGARRVYKRRGHSMLLNTLSSPLTCKVSDTMISRYKSSQSPLNSKSLNVLKYMGYLKYSNYKSLYTDGMYYSLGKEVDYLSSAVSSGFIVNPKKSYYSVYDLAELELNLVKLASNFASAEFDYEMWDIQPHIDLVSENSKRPFNTDMLRSMINLNTGFGLFLGTNHSRLDEVKEVILRSCRAKGYLSKLLVVDSSFKPSTWYKGYEEVYFQHINHVAYNVEQGNSWEEPSLVFVNNAHTMSLQELISILEYVPTGSAVYLFGSPWSGVGVLSSLASRYSSAIVLPEAGGSALESTLAAVSSGLTFSIGKNLKLSSVPSANTLFSIHDVLKRTFQAGMSREDVRVISDLEKSMSWESLGERLLSDFISVGDMSEIESGTLVFSEGVTYDLFYKGSFIGSWSSAFLGTLETYDGDYATVKLGNGDYSLRIVKDGLSLGYCLPSYVAELYPVRVSFVVCQRNRGQISRESVVRSINASQGVSFIGDTSLVVGSHSSRTSLPVTLIEKVLK